MAPPQAFVRLRSSPSSRSTARYCGANASFTSTRSICSSFIPAFASALRAAGAGPMPMCFGSTPATAQATRRPSGCRPCAFAYSALALPGAAPPSEIPAAFPALTRPSLSQWCSRPLASPAACQHRRGFTQQNELRALRNRLEARATESIHRHGGRLDRETRLESDVAGHVYGVGGRLQGIAEHRMSEIARWNAGALNRLASGGDAQVDGR